MIALILLQKNIIINYIKGTYHFKLKRLQLTLQPLLN